MIESGTVTVNVSQSELFGTLPVKEASAVLVVPEGPHQIVRPTARDTSARGSNAKAIGPCRR